MSSAANVERRDDDGDVKMLAFRSKRPDVQKLGGAIALDTMNIFKQLLGALRGDWLTGDEFLLFGGKLPRAQRIDRGLPVEPDAVVAQLMQKLGATETRRVQLDELHSRIRSVDSRGAIRNTGLPAEYRFSSFMFFPSIHPSSLSAWVNARTRRCV